MGALETYLYDLYYIRSSGAGVKETSYYGALEKLLNTTGQALKPKVRCVINIRNRGAGIPDGGLFTWDQFQKGAPAEWLPGQLPARGAIEVKGTDADVRQIANDAQVRKYLGKYGQVLVTNLWDFLLVGQGADGEPVHLERYRLAESESAFWKSVAALPKGLAAQHEAQFTEYLKRVMLHNAPLAAPADLAWFLASYARDAKARIEAKPDVPALGLVRAALENSLGLAFEGEMGDHFFRSTLVQTLFYGVFSAWVLWSKKQGVGSKELFDWKDSGYVLEVPVILALFEEVAQRRRLEPLGLVEVLDWTGTALNRVNRAAFFSRFEEEHAVQYFYEPFLEAFDPQLRKALGVWYTPPEIVRYMVERVDRALREELGLEDGLADPRVVVLDPACGTGAYLVEVLKRIAETLKAKGNEALLGHELRRAATRRVFGFEILPAPFVVAHLQMGLLLQNWGAPLSGEGERAGIYLTNSLTGWEGPHTPRQQAYLPELEQERDAAGEVKQGEEILVVLGNPPYNAFAGTSPEEERGLVEPYKEGLISKWGIKKFNLDDLYVRFFRLAERRIAEMNRNRRGVVCYISNFSYLSDPSFVVMRERFLSEFDRLWFDSMNGDSRGTGKLTPDGEPDPSVFSTEYNREGIRIGTSIALLVRKAVRDVKPAVRFRQFWGSTKRTDLLQSLQHSDIDADYTIVEPRVTDRLSFQPSGASSSYLAWPKVAELSALAPMPAFMESRRGALISIDKSRLEARMRLYFDPNVSWDELKQLAPLLTEDAARFDAKLARAKLLAVENFFPDRLRRYMLRPMETRWCYFTPTRPLWNEPRPDLWAQCWPGNTFLVTRLKTEKEAKGSPLYFSSCLVDYQSLARNVSVIPVQLSLKSDRDQHATQAALFSEATVPVANLSPKAQTYLTSIGIEDWNVDVENAGLVWMHALAIGYSPAYLAENADGIRQDWPRVPLPTSKEGLVRSAALGRQVAALLDTESAVPGVTAGAVRRELQHVAVIAREGGGQLNPDAGELEVTAGWGHAGKEGVTMPGKGRMSQRAYTAAEQAAIEEGAQKLGLSAEEAFARLGENTRDVYLNKKAYWKNVPGNVWEYTIGGYQVMKKWLSYREKELLGRALSAEEAMEVTGMARRIAAILLLEPKLDENYRLTKESAYSWAG
ncbi:MAG TPA: type ISP restriction/modification enzyme [Chloroflexia bacterium]|jgi:hypothetical protein